MWDTLKGVIWGLVTSPQMRVDNRQIISYFSYISKGFYIKRAAALQVVISSSINCSVLAIHSVQTQHWAFKFLLTQRFLRPVPGRRLLPIALQPLLCVLTDTGRQKEQEPQDNTKSYRVLVSCSCTHHSKEQTKTIHTNDWHRSLERLECFSCSMSLN